MLTSADCRRVVGDARPDDALVLGAIFPLTGASASEGLPLAGAMELAATEFQSNANGLPPRVAGGPARPIVVVECDDGGTVDGATRASRHLVGDLGVPAIVGGAFSGIAIKISTGVTIPGGTMLISPSATSVAITDLADQGLVWRTAPSDVLQAAALVGILSQIETDVRAAAGFTGDLRVAVLYKGDSYGGGLYGAFAKDATFNQKAAVDNGAAFLDFDYGNPDDPASDAPKYDAVGAKIAALQPHVIAIFGTEEVVTEILPRAELAAAGGPAPRYLLADGARLSEIAQKVAADPTLRARIVGTSPGTNNANYKAFLDLYRSKISDGTSPGVFGAAGAYDATYLLAYAAIAVGDAPITGASLAAAMGSLVPRAGAFPTKVGAAQITKASTALQQGKQLDFDGASGPLDFDLTTGDALSDIQLWCVPLGPDGKPTDPQNTSAFYDANLSALTPNALSAIKTSCNF